ncbi:MAG TPA: hypothetical protein VFD92_25620 [Candidatus Binatia bacterium]|nr:hypothetical protein [Candidatus Binatia bacterium]
MRLRRFTAATATEALRRVKDALGDDALVLSTRATPEGAVEITAAVDPDPTGRGPAGPDAADADPRRAAARRGAAIADPVALVARATSGDPADLALVHRELRQLSARVAAIDALLGDGGAPLVELGARGSEIARALESSGVARRLASPIAADFEREVAEGETRGAALARSLARHVPLASGPARRVSVFVGPSGSGKTTTIAKIAALHAMSGDRPGLVLADTHRVGAAEQLGAFARVLGVPLRAVSSAGELRGALDELAGCSPVLVDTAAFAADDVRRREAEALIASAGEPVEVTAVVSATTSTRALARAWEAIRMLGPESCALTKIDECDEPGEACTWLCEAGVALRWLANGPDVPGGLVPASSDALVRRLVAA